MVLVALEFSQEHHDCFDDELQRHDQHRYGDLNESALNVVFAVMRTNR